VLAVFAKWGLDASIVGIVTADDTMRVTHHGELVAEIPNKALTDDAPVYKRPVGVWKAPVPLDPPVWVVEELKRPRDYTADLKRLLASANICDKRWVFEQYDSMVQTNTVQGPGGEAGVMRIKDEGAKREVRRASEGPRPERGLAMALAGNGRWCWLDPKLGAMHAVAEAARKVACTGAVPVAATNCLNFGNPEKPEIMAQLSAAIDGIAEACKALDVPVTGGNVSLYNETKGEGIYPTPVIGVVGILEDVTKAVPSGFQKAGEIIVLLTLPAGTMGFGSMPLQSFGSSEYAKVNLGCMWGVPPFFQPTEERELHNALQGLSRSGLIHSACDVSDGGLAVALVRCCMRNGIGAQINLHPNALWGEARELFGEDSSLALVSCSQDDLEELSSVVDEYGFVLPLPIGQTISEPKFEVRFGENAPAISATLSEFLSSYSSTLESQLGAEVVTA
jgi:phosphoribosylformylglycinamidine synthase